LTIKFPSSATTASSLSRSRFHVPASVWIQPQLTWQFHFPIFKSDLISNSQNVPAEAASTFSAHACLSLSIRLPRGFHLFSGALAVYCPSSFSCQRSLLHQQLPLSRALLLLVPRNNHSLPIPIRIR